MADIVLTGPIVPSALNNVENIIASVAVAAGQVVYKTAAGLAALADADALLTAEVVGVAVNTAGIGEPVTVAKNGTTITQAGTTFTKAKVVYASVTAGAMADAAPASGKFSTTIGIPSSTSALLIQIQISGVASA